MWYNDLFFNRRDWLIYHFNRLEISANELVVLLIIDAMNQQNETLDNDVLMSLTNLKSNQIDSILASLAKKDYLQIKTVRNKIIFNIDGVFKKDFETKLDQAPLLELVEEAFGRLLSQNELQILTSLQKSVEYDFIVYAVRQAKINHKLTMKYVEKVALNVSANES